MREDVIRVVDAYLNALGAKDIGSAPLHPNVQFESPLSPSITGADALRQAFAGFFPMMKGIEIIRHIVDGERCATVFNMDTAFGVLPMIDCFHVVDGQIMSIRVYFDPRPIVHWMSQVAAS